MSVIVTEVGADKREFQPIYIDIKITIQTEDDLDELQSEFTEGNLEDFQTTHSALAFDVVNGIKEIVLSKGVKP